MSGVDIRELIADAHLVTRYAVRVGCLPDDELPKAVRAVEAAGTDSRGDDINRLVTSLNGAVKAIAPMTLGELRSRRSPFDLHGQKVMRRMQACFCVLTILLTAIVADLTEHLHREDTALKSLRQIQDSHPLDKLNALRKMIKFEAVLAKQDTVHFDQYQRGVRELRDLQDKLSGAYELVRSVAENGSLSYGILSSVAAHGWGLLPIGSDVGPALASTQYSYGSKDRAAVDAALQTSKASDLRDACDSAFEEKRKAVDALAVGEPWLRAAILDKVEEVCFSTKMSFLLDLPPTSGLSYQIQASMAALNGWVLPFFYGLLGSAVFVMRSLLDQRTPTLGFFPAVLRISLGGIAGIIIGWFSVPAAAKVGELASITTVPFGLAFLAGFSIDILFATLDRINRTISESSALDGARRRA